MKVILDKDLYNDIWAKVYDKFKFHPSMDENQKPFEFNVNHNVYKLNSVWTEEQEKIVNNIFKEMANEEIYVLDWHHDFFEFNPQEEIPLDYQYHDDDRNCEVYFPSYYPNGDYYFFISKDFSYGLLGHPWRKEIYVFGDVLINKFEKIKEELNITNVFDNVIIDNKFELPFKLINVDNNTQQFVFQFINFDEGQTAFSIEHGGITGRFGIGYICNGINSNFVCDITIGNVYKFYQELKNCYENVNGIATLQDYSSERTKLTIQIDDYGHCLIEGSFSNKNDLYKSSIKFTTNCDQSYFKNVLHNFEQFFSELEKIQGNKEFLY